MTLVADVNSITVSFDDGGGDWNPVLIFGDFTRTITVFMEIISGGYIVTTLENLGLPAFFTVQFQTILGVMTLGSLGYLISGRFL